MEIILRVISWGANRVTQDNTKVKQLNRTVQTAPEGNTKVQAGVPRVKIATKGHTAIRVAKAIAMIVQEDTVRVTQVIKNAPSAIQENLRVTRVNLVVKPARPGNTVIPVPRLYLSLKKTMVHASLLAPNTPMNQPPAVPHAPKDRTKIKLKHQVVYRAPSVMNRINQVYCFVTVARLVNTKMKRESQSAKVAPRVDVVQ
jgi:hypothetical protein